MTAPDRPMTEQKAREYTKVAHVTSREIAAVIRALNPGAPK